MNKAYQFPRDEPNPFAEPVAPQRAESGTNPYAAAGAEEERVPPTAGAYQQTLQPRDGGILALAISGLVLSLLSLAMAYFFVPVGLVAVPLSLAAWLMARHDLAAMHVGAMPDAPRGRVQGGQWIAIIGTVLSLISIVLLLFLFAQAFEWI